MVVKRSPGRPVGPQCQHKESRKAPHCRKNGRVLVYLDSNGRRVRTHRCWSHYAALEQKARGTNSFSVVRTEVLEE